MASFLIRTLTHTDEPVLWEMLYYALHVPDGHEPFPKEITSEPEIARYVLDWGKTNDDGFAALDPVTQRPLGAVWIRLFASDNPGYGYVDDCTPELSIAILPRYRNQGLGTGLLNRMIDEAGKQYAGLSLSVGSANPAKRLYERLGFEVIDQEGTSVTMLKRLEKLEKQHGT